MIICHKLKTTFLIKITSGIPFSTTISISLMTCLSIISVGYKENELEIAIGGVL